MIMGIGVQELLIILLIVGLVFGTKKLRNIGGDLGSAIKGFRDAFREGDSGSTGDTDSKKESLPESGTDASKQDQKPSE